jgi:type IV pilus assembly protein PilW
MGVDMLSQNNKQFSSQRGVSLIELLVGLVIGLIATLVITQIFATFEGQKRTTTGSADAQTNGSIALFTMQRDMQMAGFGLPVFDTQNPPLKCDPAVVGSHTTVDHDADAATPEVDLFPLRITDGGAGLSDTVAVRYARDDATSRSGIAVKIIGPAPAAPEVGVDNNLGCNDGDTVLISGGTACYMTTVDDPNLTADPTHISLVDATGANIGYSISCMGHWSQYTYAVVSNQLQRNDADNAPTVTPIVSEIVNLQAQYGVSDTADSNKITHWVDADAAPWLAPTVANRNRIKAIHIAVVARNGLMEKNNVSNTCTTAKGTVNNGPCAWDDASVQDAAPQIDLSGDPDWRKYRYRAYDTIIPLRNMIWSNNTL